MAVVKPVCGLTGMPMSGGYAVRSIGQGPPVLHFLLADAWLPVDIDANEHSLGGPLWTPDDVTPSLLG